MSQASRHSSFDILKKGEEATLNTKRAGWWMDNTSWDAYTRAHTAIAFWRICAEAVSAVHTNNVTSWINIVDACVHRATMNTRCSARHAMFPSVSSTCFKASPVLNFHRISSQTRVHAEYPTSSTIWEQALSIFEANGDSVSSTHVNARTRSKRANCAYKSYASAHRSMCNEATSPSPLTALVKKVHLHNSHAKH
jgi:hypothetical protein